MTNLQHAVTTHTVPIRRDDYIVTRRVGASNWNGYTFDDPWELVPGTWTMELWVGKQRLASQEFTVVKQ